MLHALLVGLLAFFLTVSDLHIYPSDECWRCDVGAWLDMPAQVAEADAVVVLGGDADARLPTAIKLLQDKIVTELWYTGAADAALSIDGSDVQRAYNAALAVGIPDQAIVLLDTTSTWEDGEAIAALAEARGTRRLVVVTSWYHGRRALCTLHHHLQGTRVEVFYQPAATPDYGPEDWWLHEGGRKTVTGELYKLLFYWAYYGVAPWKC